ncbi:gephyrin-like molybdotransferase Glp (plasmid) [Thioclava sp. 'Guangxiensis']|uniref:molybdopterin molybdotransferase MoeA n=1 Tax=Thioclava sp. 'Guangxiensis' TaxID=3149044 RepID=UPI0038779866
MDLSEARSLARAAVQPVARNQRLLLSAARGRVLAAPLIAEHAVPPFDNAAMDGFALDRASLARAATTGLPLEGEVLAGDAPGVLRLGTARRIATGAPLPRGADLVVPLERARVQGAHVLLPQETGQRRHIRCKGEDIAPGTVLAPPGTVISARLIAQAAASGLSQVNVTGPQRIALITTGSELVRPGAPLGPGQIHDALHPFLLADLDRAGLDLREFGALPDDPERLTQILLRAASEADMVLVTGGASVGRADPTTEALIRAGAVRVFHGVRMRPGKPLGLYQLSGTPVFTLPGNPFAAIIGYLFLVRPAIEAALGGPLFGARLAWHRLAAPPGPLRAQAEFLPVALIPEPGGGEVLAHVCGRGASASLSPLARAEGIALLPPGPGDLASEARVEVLLL